MKTKSTTSASAPAASAGQHWAGINEFSFLAGMRFMFWICKVFGRWPFRLILYPVLLWYVATRTQARHASQNYLRHISRTQTDQPDLSGVLNVIRHFAAFAEMMLDKMLLWSGLITIDTVQIIGSEMMKEQMQSKRGAVIICSHFGNLDLCRVMSVQNSNLKLTVLVHTKHAQAFNHLLETLNPQSQMNLMQVTEITPVTAMLLAQRVDQGEFVVIAGDRIPVADNPRVAYASFLGERAPFPVGPYILASVLQCPIYTIFPMHKRSGYTIHFSNLRKEVRLPRKGREPMLEQLVSDYARELEQQCLQAPLQWFNFYDFWHLSEWSTTMEHRK